MVDPTAMAEAYSIQELEEHMPGQHIITNILTTFGDVVKKVTFWAVLQNNVDAVRFLDDFQHAHHVGVARGIPVQTDLPGLKHDLSLVQRASIGIVFAQGLNRISGVVVDVDGRVHDAICASSQDAVEPESPGKDASYSGLRGDRRNASHCWRRRRWRGQRQRVTSGWLNLGEVVLVNKTYGAQRRGG